MVGAVVLGCEIEGLDDSKKLTKRRREALEPLIYERAQAAATGWVSASELDELGMSEALRLATRRAVQQIMVPYHEIIIDGTVNFLAGTPREQYVTTLPKADALVPSVSAASIIAKVGRDRYMAALDETHPGYGFASHAGYGVAKHRAAIDAIGVTPEHRLSFAPLQKYRTQPSTPAEVTRRSTSTTTRSIGDKGETAAANELVRQGHAILERNWKTKYCEIDIISHYNGTLYFTEVKHRKNDKAGGGLSAITPKKLRQMTFAATLYMHSQRITDSDAKLLAIATKGEAADIEAIVDVL